MNFECLTNGQVNNYITAILKGSSTKKNFHRINLIFWTVMGCGIARFGGRGLKMERTEKSTQFLDESSFGRNLYSTCHLIVSRWQSLVATWFTLLLTAH